MSRRGIDKARLKRLEKLAGLAELKAEQAKATTAGVVQARDALRRDQQELMDERTRLWGQQTTFDSARLMLRWDQLYQSQMRGLTVRLAQAEVAAERELTIARREEGRRQVLERLKNSAG